MIIFPNAKINLGLNIIRKREDGYHDIETCFYPVGWSDVLEIIESNELSFTSSGISIPGSQTNNICIKAYQLLKQDFKISPVNIHLHKLIPVGAGLGGGSSDAAFTIRLLNDKFILRLSLPEMQEYAKKLGSDCAFFINNTAVFAKGKGDEFSTLELNLKGLYCIILYPNIHISTIQAYGGVKPGASQNLFNNIKRPVEEWRNLIVNDFEASIFQKFPQLEAIKSSLYTAGALYACMSGSGSSVTGIFKSKPDLHSLKQTYNLFWEGYL